MASDARHVRTTSDFLEICRIHNQLHPDQALACNILMLVHYTMQPVFLEFGEVPTDVEQALLVLAHLKMLAKEDPDAEVVWSLHMLLLEALHPFLGDDNDISELDLEFSGLWLVQANKITENFPVALRLVQQAQIASMKSLYWSLRGDKVKEAIRDKCLRLLKIARIVTKKDIERWLLELAATILDEDYSPASPAIDIALRILLSRVDDVSFPDLMGKLSRLLPPEAQPTVDFIVSYVKTEFEEEESAFAKLIA